mmetsp:Transcript_23018/g.39473  ORF Transcript_23018/g.39473 Transcript_23018/m.39473 type:complete len:207 (+) Transcript_23018:2179-2799(+)
MPFKIQVCALPKAISAQNGGHHADHLSSFLIHSHRVEVVHRDVRLRPNGMGHWTRILPELCRPQPHDIPNSLHSTRIHIRRELLVAVHRQPLLERKLEPVPTSHAVSGPVVEILVPNHTLDAGEIRVRSSLGVGQNITIIENIERLVLHGPHVEVGHGHYIELVQVVLPPKTLLIPFERLFETLHGMRGLVFVAMLHKDPQQHFPA